MTATLADTVKRAAQSIGPARARGVLDILAGAAPRPQPLQPPAAGRVLVSSEETDGRLLQYWLYPDGVERAELAWTPAALRARYVAALEAAGYGDYARRGHLGAALNDPNFQPIVEDFRAGKSVLLAGPTNGRKTTLALALGWDRCSRPGQKAPAFAYWPVWSDTVKEEMSFTRAANDLAKSSPLVILDEVGLDRQTKVWSDSSRSLLQTLVSLADSGGIQMIITTNFDMDYIRANWSEPTIRRIVIGWSLHHLPSQGTP